MPSTTLEPSAVGNYDTWTLAAGASKYEAVQLPDDDATTRISSGTLNQRQSFTLPNLPAGSVQIDSVDIHVRASKSGATAEKFKVFTRVSSTDLDYTERAPAVAGTYEEWDETGVARPGGGTWTVADVNGAEIGVVVTAAAGNACLVTTLNMPVTYQLAGEVTIWLLQWLPPLIGLGSALSFREIAAALSHLKTRPSNREEFEAIRAALRRRPRFA